jgi:hypothetical protein
VTGRDSTLDMPAPPALADPVGPLDFGLLAEAASGEDLPFAVAGTGACVTGGTLRGVDLVRIHPLRAARGPRVKGATVLGATITPLGVERALQVAGCEVVERVVAPRDGAFCLFEWEASGGAVELALEWRVDLTMDDGRAPDIPGPLRWRQGPTSLMTESGDPERRAFFVLGGASCHLVVREDINDPPGLAVTARAEIPAGSSIRLAILGGPATVEPGLSRALRSANRGRAVVLARRGSLDRLAAETVSLESPNPALDRALGWACVGLADRVVEVPGVGRWLVPGYGPAPLSLETAAGVRGALDCLVTGQFETARVVLTSLARFQAPSGGIPSMWAEPGSLADLSGGDPTDSWLYLLLLGRYLAWTGDVPFVGAAWPGALRVLGFLRQVGTPAGPGSGSGSGQTGTTWGGAIRGAALEALVGVAEAVGDGATAGRLRGEWGAGAGGGAGGGVSVPSGPGGDEVIARLRALMGAEPDATRGRLVLRPRPPAGWDAVTVRGLTVGDSAVTLVYSRGAGVHRFRVRQDRGAAPVRLILEPELDGRFVAARVDGVLAELEPVDVGVDGGRVRVPVQVMLDHERVVEVEMEA